MTLGLPKLFFIMLLGFGGHAYAGMTGCERFATLPGFGAIHQTCLSLLEVLPQQQLPEKLDCDTLKDVGRQRCIALRVAVTTASQQAPYADYQARATILAALTESLPLRTAIQLFHLEHSRLPATLAELGETLPKLQYATSLSLAADGVITIGLPAGTELRLLPQLKDGLLDYQCQASGIETRLLPSSCHLR